MSLRDLGKLKTILSKLLERDGESELREFMGARFNGNLSIFVFNVLVNQVEPHAAAGDFIWTGFCRKTGFE